MLLRCVIPLLLVLSSHAAKPTAVDKQGPILCEGGLGEQCGGVSGAGDVWENSENGAICCAKGYICQYKTMYYSECVALPMDELPKRKLDDADTAAQLSLQGAIDIFYMVINAQIVFFMQAGFAMLEVGIISPKNAKSILFKNLLDMCIVALTWWLWGFGLAGNGASGQYVENGTSFGDFGLEAGTTKAGVGRFGGLDWGNSAPFLHSLVFATTTTTIMSGGVAERMKVEVYIFLSVVLSSFVYSTVISWGWANDGFLKKMGFVDFAGSCLVHLVGGCAALVGAVLVGPRRNRFRDNGKVVSFKSTSLVLSSLGAMMLAFSWISFNGSSILTTGNGNIELASHAVVNTMLSLGSAGVTSVAIESILHNGTYDLPHTINSMLGGLVAVTGACAFIDNWNAVILGVFSSIITKSSSHFIMRKCFVDDPLDAFSVHGACGVLGTVWVGLFARKDLLEMVNHTKGEGLFHGGDPELLLAQLAGCGVCISFTFASILGASLFFHFIFTMSKKLIGSNEIVMEGIELDEDGALYDEDESATTDSVDIGNLGFFERVMLSLRFSKDAEIVGADFIYHEGNAFELTKNQVVMYNQEKNAQERIQRRRDTHS